LPTSRVKSIVNTGAPISPVSIIRPVLHANILFIYYLRYKISATVSVFNKTSRLIRNGKTYLSNYQ